jgi:hypothetical protein
MRRFLVAAAAGLGIAFVTGCAHQQPFATDTTVVSSEPGKGVIARTIELSMQVIAIDRPTRTVTLKGPEGKVADVVAGDEVRNFDQIRVGDRVVVRYIEALSLELRKTTAGGGDITASAAATRAAAGKRPGGTVTGQVTAIAEVIAVDPANMLITLLGPKGNIVDLRVQNPDHFKVVKTGDQVEVTYTQAMALSVEPARK